MEFKTTINDRVKYSVFKAKATLFVVSSRWKREHNLKIGDTVIVLDPNANFHFLTNMQIIGFTQRGEARVQGNNYGSAFNIASVRISQCAKYNPNVHTMAWRIAINRIAELK